MLILLLQKTLNSEDVRSVNKQYTEKQALTEKQDLIAKVYKAHVACFVISALISELARLTQGT